MMKLWLLRPLSLDKGPWSPWYDKAFGFVVRAESEESARALATERGGDEIGSYSGVVGDAWTNPEFSSCVVLTDDGEPEVVIRDFASA